MKFFAVAVQKSSFFWVTLKKSVLSVIFGTTLSTLSHTQEQMSKSPIPSTPCCTKEKSHDILETPFFYFRAKCFESLKKSIFRVIHCKRPKWVQFFNVDNEGFNSLSVMLNRNASILWDMLTRRVQVSLRFFFEKNVNHFHKGFNYLNSFSNKSQFKKVKSNIKGLILQVILHQNFHFLSHMWKSPYWHPVQFFESYFEKPVQFCASAYWQMKMFYVWESAWKSRVAILWDIVLSKRRFNSWTPLILKRFSA